MTSMKSEKPSGVWINGVEYAPANSANHTTKKVGLAITTRNRNEHLTDVLAKWRLYTPTSIPIIIVDDASSTPVKEATYRFEENVGIALAKNKSLELLQEMGVTEYFLADDDVYPTEQEWWKPYVSSPEPHLMAMFKDLKGVAPLNDITILQQTDTHIAYSGPRGYLLYANQLVIETVGGMDPIYGKWGYEHGDWSNRIYHAGLTSWRYADVINGETIFHSMDQHVEIKRSVSQGDRQKLVRTNAGIHNDRRESRYEAYVPLNPAASTAIITCLYGQKPDPQRPNQTMTLKATHKLLQSVKDHQVILYTDLPEESLPHSNTHTIPSTLTDNVFFQRHLNAYQHLRDNPHIQWAWCVDATDVEMLTNPYPHMKQDTLYVGYEPSTLANPWMKDVHPTPNLHHFLEENSHLQLLNAGVFGGHRDVLLPFLHKLVEYHHDRAMKVWHKKIADTTELGDMGAFNYITYNLPPEVKLQWGTQVTTLFKAEERNDQSWWKHK